ncbi:hypothetical protein N7456_011064 [Penicillium angulare]|uniref:Uncharacterized protein n=1 Tax=Penicillium angulare TaxID=116970 RepID=A0A9W9JZI9_9EURO|nr:hypothetical protein N7456_011064 [Penicillium angulare]
MIDRRSKVRREPEPIPTVLVDVPHNPIPMSSQWRKAAIKIHKILNPQFPGISVEIIDSKLMRRPRYFPVPPGHSIISKWERICNNILEVSDYREWTGISLWRYGVEDSPTLDRLTVIVGVLESSVNLFTDAARRIRGILAMENEKDIDVLFMKNERFCFADEVELTHEVELKFYRPLEQEMCTHRFLLPGVSMGIHNSTAGTSTMGGIVRLRRGSNWFDYGLTCFPCVDPPPNDPMAKRTLQVDQPSTFDLQNTIANLNEKIERFTDANLLRIEKNIETKKQGAEVFVTPSEEQRYYMIIECIESFKKQRLVFEKVLVEGSHRLGHISFGSGANGVITEAGKSRVSDWALIEPFNYAHESPGLLPFYPHPLSEKLISQDHLVKFGRSTGKTSGYYNKVRELQILRVNDPTQRQGFRIVTTFEHSVV